MKNLAFLFLANEEQRPKKAEKKMANDFSLYWLVSKKAEATKRDALFLERNHLRRNNLYLSETAAAAVRAVPDAAAVLYYISCTSFIAAPAADFWQLFYLWRSCFHCHPRLD